MASVWGELKRRNVVKVAVAYAIVGWILVEVSSTVLPIFEAPDWIVQVLTFFVILGFPLALILSWAYEITPEGIKLERDVAAGESITHVTGRKIDFVIIGLLVLAVGYMFVDNYLPESGPFAGAEIDPASLEVELDEPPSTAVERAAPVAEEQQREFIPNSVAVLLCDNLSPDPDDAYIAASIHDEILNQLVKIRALSVIAKTSVLQYADAPPPISQIAEELNVEAVMECSVRYAGSAILVTAQLIDPETNIHLWSDTYPGDMSDLSMVFAMQADIAMNIANAVGAEFSLEEQTSIEKIPTDSPEAYDFYLLAISANQTVLPVALAYLDQAIEADPDFARAYALRAQVNLNQLRFNRRLDDSRRADLEARVLQDLDDARALDPNLGFAHLVLGQFHGFNWRGADARAGYELAYELSPNDTTVLANYGYSFLSLIGEHQKAIELAQQAAELDPSFGGAPLAGVYYFAGDLERASAVFRTVLELNPANIRSLTSLGLIEINSGDEEEARRLLRLAELSGPDSLIFLPQIIYGYSRLGMQDDVERLVAQHEAVASGQRVAAANSALINLALGDHEEALRILESTAENKDPYDAPFPLMHIKWNLYRDPVLDQAEFAAVRERLGFTDL